jgi:hypothetical protein
MISLVVGAPRDKTPQETLLEIEYYRALLSDVRFERLLSDTGDRIVNDWSKATNTADAEACRYRLQGLQAMLKQMQTTVEQGLSSL